ncbi:MAG: PCRF domain-containing protein, partial [Flammeovirgaceae bacterium]
MIDKLERVRERFEEVSQIIVKPETMSDMKYYAQINKEYKELEKIVAEYKKYEDVLSNLNEAKDILEHESDPEFKEMAKMELDELSEQKVALEEALKIMLVPKDPN